MNTIPLSPSTGTPQRPPFGCKTVFLDRDGILKVLSGNTGLITVLEESDGGDPLAQTAVQPDDSRLSDARTPSSTLAHAASHGPTGTDPLAAVATSGSYDDLDEVPTFFNPSSHAHGSISSDGKVGTTENLPLKTGAGGVVEVGAFGAGSTDFAAGDHNHSGVYATASQGQTADAALPKSGGTMTGNLTIGAGSNILFTNTVWDDLRFPAQAINPAGNAAPPTVSQATGMLEFQGNADNVIAGQAQLPHSWKHGTALHPHLHLIFPTNNTLNSRWKFEYKVYPVTGPGPVYADPYTVLETMTVANPNSPSTMRIIEPTATIPMTGQVGSATVLWKISRLASSDALDTDTSAIVLTEFDIHFEIDKIGSDDELPT